MDFGQLEQALLPYEKKLKAQEKFRRSIGVKEVDHPTYERYLSGDIEKFDRRKISSMLLRPDNPFGKEVRERVMKRIGPKPPMTFLDYSELEPVDRIGQSLTHSSGRLCREYHPANLPVTPQEGRFEIDDTKRMAGIIKKMAMYFGAEMVRITKIDQRWVYQDLDIKHKYAIVVVVSHENSFLSTAPSHYSFSATGEAYSKLKYIVTQLTDFICGLGHDAAYRETLAFAPELTMVPLAIDAGIGEFARTGHCLSPEFGVNMRMKAVTTDLPLEVDKPISFGVHDFCMNCENCAAFCPGNAIPFGPPQDTIVDVYNREGVKKWNLNAEKCLILWNINRKKWNSCGGKCLYVCPWNKPMAMNHNIVRNIAIHAPGFIKKWLVAMDRKLYKRTKKILI